MLGLMSVRRYAGIDPGLTSGGLVVVERGSERIVAARSLVPTPATKREATESAEDALGSRAFTAADILAAIQARAAATALSELIADHGPITAVCVEGFIDQPSRVTAEKKGLVKERWKTPLMIGHLSEQLATVGFRVDLRNLAYTDAGVVIKHFSVELSRLAARRRGDRKELVAPGDHLLTNDHLRKAWAHASWLSLRHKDLSIGSERPVSTGTTAINPNKELS